MTLGHMSQKVTTPTRAFFQTLLYLGDKSESLALYTILSLWFLCLGMNINLSFDQITMEFPFFYNHKEGDAILIHAHFFSE
jgi:hypothetical protein